MSWCSVKAVVLAGGSGTRFWPLSRAHRPKQLLPLWGGKTLLGATLERILPLVGWEGVLVVTGQHLAPAVAEHLPKLPPQQLLREPCGRDTAAAVGWAAWREVSQGGNPVLVVLPADHWVGDDEAFRQVVRAGVALAQGTNGLVTVALSPTRPETGYGYLELGEVVEAREGVRCFRVRRFVEKPTVEKAQAFLAAGNYRWNGGIFAFTAQALVAAVRQYLPALAEGLDQLVELAKAVGEEEAVQRVYPSLPQISLDFGVMERASNIWAVEGTFPWQDVGSFASFAQLLPPAEGGVSLGSVVAVDSANCVLLSQGPLVAALGVEDLVVVATPEAVLVTTREQAQKVKDLVKELERRGLHRVL